MKDYKTEFNFKWLVVSSSIFKNFFISQILFRWTSGRRVYYIYKIYRKDIIYCTLQELKEEEKFKE